MRNHIKNKQASYSKENPSGGTTRIRFIGYNLSPRTKHARAPPFLKSLGKLRKKKRNIKACGELFSEKVTSSAHASSNFP